MRGSTAVFLILLVMDTGMAPSVGNCGHFYLCHWLTGSGFIELCAWESGCSLMDFLIENSRGECSLFEHFTHTFLSCENSCHLHPCYLLIFYFKTFANLSGVNRDLPFASLFS